MKQAVTLSLRGKQTYQDQEPEIIELVTDGILEQRDDCWYITYQESCLTGLEGVTTTFQIEPDRITLTRTGRLNSQMVFQPGHLHNSLYQMEFGALMITVCASQIRHDLSETGGAVDLVYAIEVEQSAVGMVEYHLDIQPKHS